MSRLISVDELKEWVKNWFDVNRNYHPYSKQNNIPISELYDILERMPTIERKTGMWIKKGTQMHINLDTAREQYTELGYPHRNISVLMCDVCRKITLVDESIKYNFCPHCGAKNEDEK